MQRLKDIFCFEVLAEESQYWQPFLRYPVWACLSKYLRAVTRPESAFTHQLLYLHRAGGERTERETQQQGTNGGIVGLLQALLKLFGIFDSGET